jgi:hypothetical protein
MDGMGWVHTSSPTAPVTGWPCSFQASTAHAQLAALHLPRDLGQLAVAANEGAAKIGAARDVAHQIGSGASPKGTPAALRAANCAVPQRCTSSAAASRCCPARGCG